MDDLKTNEICDKCQEPIKILIADFELAMKDGLPILCSNCKTLIEEAEDGLPFMVFKYKSVRVDRADFNVLGAEGWELIAVDNGQAYFKKEYFEES